MHSSEDSLNQEQASDRKQQKDSPVYLRIKKFALAIKELNRVRFQLKSEYSAAWLAQLLWEQWVGGSNPSTPIYFPNPFYNQLQQTKEIRYSTLFLFKVSYTQDFRATIQLSLRHVTPNII